MPLELPGAVCNIFQRLQRVSAMSQYEYKVIPTPRRAKRAKGVKGEAARFANVLTDAMNVEAAEGWEFVRAQRREELPEPVAEIQEVAKANQVTFDGDNIDPLKNLVEGHRKDSLST